MKKTTLLLILLSALHGSAQQSFSSNFINDVKKPFRNEPVSQIYRQTIILKKLDLSGKTKRTEIRGIRKEKRQYQRAYRSDVTLDLPIFGVSGLGNLNQESLESINASGKFSVFARPLQFRNNSVSIYASINKNASNNDSLIFNKLIFPEIGSSSFIGALQFDKYWKYDSCTGHVLSGFFEFGYKKIVSDSSFKNQKLYFNSLSYTAGFKYIYGFSRKSGNGDSAQTNLSFFAIPYVSALNIPDEDTSDYKALIIRAAGKDVQSDLIKDNIYCLGVKLGFQINSLQVFADFRGVLGKTRTPVRELQGFHANLGFIFNADVLSFKTKSKKVSRENGEAFLERIKKIDISSLQKKTG